MRSQKLNTVIDDETGEQEIARILKQKLKDYNESKIGPYTRKPFTIYIGTESKKIIAGISGDIVGDQCYVAIMWVDEDYRRQGLGTKLIHELEQYLKDKNCYSIQLDTTEFQSKEFYEKCDFVILATIPRGFMGQDSYIMRKVLG